MYREEEQTAQTVNKAHGRREKRTIRTTCVLNRYRDDWPKRAQVIRVERQRTRARKTTVEVAYDITSLSEDRADASRRLELIRSHWGMENRQPDYWRSDNLCVPVGTAYP